MTFLAALILERLLYLSIAFDSESDISSPKATASSNPALIWMFASQYLSNALNSIHELALRLIYNDFELPFDRVVEKNKQKKHT